MPGGEGSLFFAFCVSPGQTQRLTTRLFEAGHMNMPFGLEAETIARIKDMLAEHGEVEEAIIYGSRTKGTSKPGSDIDISLKERAIDLHVLNKISHEFDELSIPYRIDVSNYDRIDNPDLSSHIDRVGKLLYKRQGKESATDQNFSPEAN